MMLTIETAGATWCPMVRIATIETLPAREYDGPDGGELVDAEDVLAAGCNTGTLGYSRMPASCRCIADRCAMWRWTDKGTERRARNIRWPEEDDPLTEPPRPANLIPSWEWVPITGDGEDIDGGYWAEPMVEVEAEHARIAAARRGYCGLAGALAVTP